MLGALCLRVPFLKQDMDGYGIQVIHPKECPTALTGMTLGMGHRAQPTAQLVSTVARRSRRERIPHLRLGVGNGAPLDVGGTLVLPLEWRRVCRGTS